VRAQMQEEEDASSSNFLRASLEGCGRVELLWFVGLGVSACKKHPAVKVCSTAEDWQKCKQASTRSGATTSIVDQRRNLMHLAIRVLLQWRSRRSKQEPLLTETRSQIPKQQRQADRRHIFAT